jgi:hypothetical protein
MKRDHEIGKFALAHHKKLRLSVSALLHWAVLTLLGWSLFLSISIGDACFMFLTQAKGKIEVSVIVRGYAATLTLALVTTIGLYLLHWSLWKKIEVLPHDGK